MKKVFAIALALALTISSLPGLAAELTGAQIMAKVDKNAYFPTSHMQAKMVIRSRNRELVKEMEIWSDAEKKAGLAVFHNPGDRGTKYLKLGDELWMFFPNADDLVKISGHMLRQGMMGSDISYSDAMESEKLTELYSFSLIGTENIEGRPCYVVEANALPDAKVSYAKRKACVDMQWFVPMREELYAASGKLLKVAETKEVRVVGDRHIATHIVMSDQLKRNSSTALVLTDIEVGVEIPDGMLSLRSLMR